MFGMKNCDLLCGCIDHLGDSFSCGIYSCLIIIESLTITLEGHTA